MKGDPGDASAWFRLSRRDLDKARRDLAQGDLPYSLIQLQQAAEKACKGWLLARGWSLVKTHDLVFLLEEIRIRGIDVDEFKPAGALLSKEFLEERYISLDAEPEPTEPEARKLLDAVDRLFEILNIPPDPVTGSP